MSKTESKNNNNNTTDVGEEYSKSDDKAYNFFLDSSLPYYSVILAYCMFYIGIYFKNQFIGVVFVYVILPLVDFLIPIDVLNPSKEKASKLKKDIYFKFPLYFAVSIEIFTYFYGIYHLLDNNFNFLYKATCIFVLATMQGVSINYSHELMHKLNYFDNCLGAFLLIKNFYIHWFIEHNYGHHTHVATPLDPASAVKGQTVYEFIPQSLIGTFTSSLKIETEMVKENNRSIFTHRIYLSILTYIVTLALLYKFLGFYEMIMAFVIGFSGPLYLEVINYVEHYGLRRKKLSDGNYEPVSIHHSWNTPHRITNYMLFKLQRHSDHHANALKPYQILCSYDESPNLPNGYAFCILLALFPSSWFDIIDPLVDDYAKNNRLSTSSIEIADKKSKSFNLKAGISISSLIILQIIVNNIF